MPMRKETQYKKATKAEKEVRIQEVYKLVVSGVPRFQIVDIITTKYNIKTRMVDVYIREVWSLMEKDSEHDRKRLRYLASSRYTRILNRALSSGDLKSAISAQEKIDKLNFLHVLSEQDMNVIKEDEDGTIDLRKLSDSELDTMIAIQDKIHG